MKVSAVTPSAAAADPAHPDHDRWVKETTLEIEVKHAQRVGKTLRDAEAENAHWLARAEAKARNAKPASASTPRKPRKQRLEERGVTVTAPRQEISLLKLSPCGRCGVCRNCMRERRVLAIMQKRKDGGPVGDLAQRLIAASWQFALKTGGYAQLSKRDRDRRLTAAVEEICNLSSAHLGEWRK